MATKTPTAKQLLAVAKAEIGVREGRDSNGNWNNRVKYNDWYAAKVKNNSPRFYKKPAVGKEP